MLRRHGLKMASKGGRCYLLSSSKCAKGVGLMDLAASLDSQIAAVRKECRQPAGSLE